MHLSDLKNKKIGILGFGMEGAAVAHFLTKNKLSFSVFDIALKDSEIKKIAKENHFRIEHIFTGLRYLDRISDFEILFRSPGIKLLEPELIAAKEKGIQITSQIKFFLENCPAKIIGITGTKGKGTSAKLLYEILQAAGVRAYLAGNYGIEALSLLGQVSSEDYIILELSSFQLQDLELSPHIAVVLMIVPEHLDYHASATEYVQAKSAITNFQIKNDIAVINSDSEYAMQVGKQGNAKKMYVQTLSEENLDLSDPFKIYEPKKYLKIKDGIFAEQLHGNIYFVDRGELQFFMNANEVSLRGFHNIQNICAAALVARALTVKESIIIESVKNYKGLEHRLEFVAEKNGIKFYNDSIGTTPQSALAAIKAFHEPVFAIIGGANKRADYFAFTEQLAKQKNLRAVSLLGEIGAELKSGLEKNNFSGKIFSGAKSMKQAFSELLSIAVKGDVLLLAPGTSSFGIFENYKDRGQQFKQAVAALKEKSGKKQ